MKKKKINRSKFKSNILLRILQFIIILLIIISGFIYFKYWPTISFLYNDATTKVNNCTVDTFDTNKSNNINALNNKDPLYLKSALIPQRCKKCFCCY